MFDLSGQTALVTGASGGIGGAIARALHGQGAEVMVAGTRRDALEALAAELGTRSHIGLADLGDAAGPDRLVKDAVEFLATVAALGDAEPLALKIDQGLGGRFQNLGRQHGRPCAEVEDTVAHGQRATANTVRLQRL